MNAFSKIAPCVTVIVFCGLVGFCPAAIQITIAPHTEHQTMDGFGAAISWYNTWIYGGNNANDDALNQLMFNDSGLDILRIKNWYYPGEGEESPAAAAAKAVNDARAINPDIQILLSSWSPPVSLKSNGDRKNGGTLKSDVDGFMYDELAAYWVDLLNNMGWTPDYLSFQNEPGWTATWESCIFSPTEGANASYGIALDTIWNAIKDLPNCPKIVSSDTENMPNFFSQNSKLQDRDFIDVNAYHTYDIGSTPSNIDSAATLTKYHQIRDDYGSRPNWMTEFSSSAFSWITQAWAIHAAVTEADASGYVFWKLAWGGDTPGQDTMIELTATDGSYIVNDYFYTIKHYAKYVDKGYKRIETSGSDSSVKVSGYLSTDRTKITLVAVNKNTSAEQITLDHSLTVSASEGYQSVTDSYWQTMTGLDIANPIDLPALSLTTLVLTLSGPLTVYTVIFDEGAYGTRTGGGALTQIVEAATSATAPTITPDSGYTFDGWDSMAYTNVTSNMTVNAQYSAITYTLTYQAGANGAIDGAATQTVSYGGDGSQVTAVADGGHQFVNWSDASTANPRTDTGVMGDITVTASFATNQPPVVDNGAGATDLTETSAQISGQLTSGGNAAAWFCWGLTDSGIGGTGAWDNVISMGAVYQGVPFATNVTGLATNTTYFYRCYATNEYGADWSDSVESFSGTPVGAGSSWTPAEIATVAWYDAADPDTVLMNGSSVSNWLDKSGNARHAIQTNEVNRPTYNAADAMVSNLPSIGDISGTGAIGLDTPSFAAKNVYVVTYYKDGVDAAFDTYDTLLSGPGQYGLYRVAGNVNTTNFTLAGFYQFNDAGNYKNGSTNDSGGVLPMPASLLKMKSSVARTQVYALGYNQRYTNRDWKGSYCEWIFTDGTEDAATEQQIEGYLAHKWKLSANLPVGHPYKENAPGGGGGIIANMAPTGITATGAVLHASVDASGTDYDVYVFWGTSDGGTNAGPWSTNAHLGSVTDMSTNFSYAADTLMAGQTNYYTFLASNATEMVWATPSWMFSTPGEPVPTLNLTVNTEHGTAVPSGLTTPASNSVVNALIIDSPVLNGNTQYVCTGWVATGSAPASGSTTNMSFNITNDTTITWQWQTNYWVDLETTGN